MFTLRSRTLVAFFAGVALTVVAGFTFQTWRADAAPGDADTTFVPITPCRLFDTRDAADVPFGPNIWRSFLAHGNNGNCTIPPTAAGLSMNVTAVDPTMLTFLTVYPDDQPRPLASSLNPAPGQPPTPNAVTTELSPGGRFRIYNLEGVVDVIVDINGYYTKTSLTQLANDIAALKALTASMSSVTVDGQPTVRFSDVNLQIVDGSGDTDGAVNGRGNLIVGYNESISDTRTGSHNLIVGPYHSYSSYGGFIAGYDNTVSDRYASVSGGTFNTASADSASVSGGEGNTANGYSSSVSGGYFNTASTGYSSVSGGQSRSANTNQYDWVAGALFQDD